MQTFSKAARRGLLACLIAVAFLSAATLASEGGLCTGCPPCDASSFTCGMCLTQVIRDCCSVQDDWAWSKCNSGDDWWVKCYQGQELWICHIP